MSAFKYEIGSDQIAVVTMDMPGQPVNTMNDDYLPAMEEAVQNLERDKDKLKGAILTSAKSTFFAGGDLKTLVQAKESDKPEIYASNLQIKSQLRRLEQLGIPVVAAINGAALGGGLEIALACHYRVAFNDRATKIGLPEVTLGLLPGGGGVVRVVRMLGLQASTPYLIEGKQVSPEEAKAAGLIHETADSIDAMMQKARDWINSEPVAVQPWDDPNYKIPGGTAKDPEVAGMLPVASAMIHNQTRGLMPAPEYILSVAVESTLVDFDTALRIEARYFTDLVTTQVAKNIITTFFFGMNELKAGGSRPKGVEKYQAKKVGILGAGMMGSGIAYSTARAGIDVVLKDVSIEAAEKGKSYSEGLLNKAVERGRMNEEKKTAILNSITATASAADLSDCDLIIEAVFEDIDLKATVTKEAEAAVSGELVMASNTSTLPITLLAEASGNAEKFIGLHFFSPVDKMPLVEIICGEQTSPETLAKAFDFVLQIKKIPIVVNDSRGFFTSRVYGSFLDEGCRLLREGVDPVLIENLAKQVGMPVGPLAGQDEVSQQLAIKITETNRLLDEKMGVKTVDEDNATYEVACKLVKEYDRAGKAHGGGFYEYPEGGKKHIWPELYNLYVKQDHGISNEDIKDRILFRQALEAVHCVEEGVLNSTIDCNIGSVFGIGFPQWTGGQLQYINGYGLKNFVNRAQELANKYGDKFAPPALLVDKAEAGEIFN